MFVRTFLGYFYDLGCDLDCSLTQAMELLVLVITVGKNVTDSDT